MMDGSIAFRFPRLHWYRPCNENCRVHISPRVGFGTDFVQRDGMNNLYEVPLSGTLWSMCGLLLHVRCVGSASVASHLLLRSGPSSPYFFCLVCMQRHEKSKCSISLPRTPATQTSRCKCTKSSIRCFRSPV